MVHRSATTRVASLVALASSAMVATAHPLCFYGPDRAVDTAASATFCPDEDAEGFCCTPDEEDVLAAKYGGATLSATCDPLYKEVLCGICNPYSAHLFTRLQTDDGMAMTAEFCSAFVEACAKDLALPDTYCDEHVLAGTTDEYWSYPLNIDTSYSDTELVPAFPNLDEDKLPTEPMTMQLTPDGKSWWIGGLAGVIKRVDVDDPSTAEDVLDISSKIVYSYEQGLMSFALSPSFTTTGLFYATYGIPGEDNAENAINVLSKFTYKAGDTTATHESEEVLMTTTEKATSVHSSGWLGFEPSSYKDPTGAYHDLFWTVGDGGPQNDPENKAQDNTIFHGTVVRIAVPSDPGASGYEIPAGNPFDGSNGRAEICAWGLRNPYSCGFDRDTDQLYCGDVGQDAVEEIDAIVCGQDYGWTMFEGSRCNGDCSGLDRADYAFPVFEYCHFDYDSTGDDVDVCGDRTVTGLAVIGGTIYRGSKYDDILGGHYIFADFSTGALHHLVPTDDGWVPGTIVPTMSRVAAFGEDQDGELYIVGYQGNIYELPCGNLCGGGGSSVESCLPQAHSTPTYEAVGCFGDGDPDAMSLSRAPLCGVMNAALCASYCGTIEGSTHFGLQYQRECYCSGKDDDYAAYGKLDIGDCDMPCSGYPDEMCGGSDKMNVFALVEGDDTVVAADTVTTLKEPASDNYIGCYNDDNSSRALKEYELVKIENMIVPDCEDRCASLGATIFAVEYGQECLCGTDESDFEIYGKAETCDTPCAGDAETACGGYEAMHVYTVTTNNSDDDSVNTTTDDGYMGCYADVRYSRKLRVAMLSDNEMTVQKCKVFCTGEETDLCGLEYGEECWCGDSDFFNATKVDDDQCNYACAGDLDSACGGYLTVDVYELS